MYLIYLIYLPIYLSTYLPIYLSTYLPIYLPIYLSIYLSKYLSHLSLHLSYLKRSSCARLPSKVAVGRCKAKQYCETSFRSDSWQAKNEAILRDVLTKWKVTAPKRRNSTRLFNFRSWQHQKRSNSARPRSKMESWAQSWQPRANAFLEFATPSI